MEMARRDRVTCSDLLPRIAHSGKLWHPPNLARGTPQPWRSTRRASRPWRPRPGCILRLLSCVRVRPFWGADTHASTYNALFGWFVCLYAVSLFVSCASCVCCRAAMPCLLGTLVARCEPHSPSRASWRRCRRRRRRRMRTVRTRPFGWCCRLSTCRRFG